MTVWYCKEKVIIRIVDTKAEAYAKVSYFTPVCFSPSMTDPIPGAYKNPCVPMPFLSLDPNVLTTEVSYRAASMFDWQDVEVVGPLRYEIYLTYMYERDLSERKYWDTLIGTRTLQGLKENGKMVSRMIISHPFYLFLFIFYYK